MAFKKESRFDLYCPKCVHYKKAETEEPCDDCLDIPVHEETHKPEHFTEKTNGRKTSKER